MTACYHCYDAILPAFDVVSKQWIALDPQPVRCARFALAQPKVAVDMMALPLTLEEIPREEIAVLSPDQRALLMRLYNQKRYQAHRTAKRCHPPGLTPLCVALDDVFQGLVGS